jgi:urease accessory protein
LTGKYFGYDDSSTPVRAAQTIADARTASDIGRRGRLELRFAVRGGRTVLTEAYAEPPFRVGRTFQEGDGVHMIMASSAPGVFGGDCLEQTIHVESGARVRLTSQSALQAHPSGDDAAATLRSRYLVDEGGDLSCFWDPLIPFPGARIDQRFSIELAAHATLTWSDAFMAGREARGERWTFASLVHELRLVRSGGLDYLERFRINAGDATISAPWRGAANCYFGSMVVSREDVCSSTAEAIHRELCGVAAVHASADVIAPGLMLARIAAASGPAFHAARLLAAAGPKPCATPEP